MSMTVIFSNAGDEDCQTLRNLWKDIDDVKVIEYTAESDDDVSKALDAIASEDDFLIFCGHGSPYGLYLPNFHGMLFCKKDIPLVHAKKVLCIWCHASSFCKINKFNVLTSSMYISNPSEAYYNGIDGVSYDEVTKTNTDTFNEMNQYIKDNVPLNEWPDRLMDSLDFGNKVDRFNREGMMYLGD